MADEKMRRFKVGDKVRVKSKSLFSSFEYSKLYKTKVGYITMVVGHPYSKQDDVNHFVVDLEPGTETGDYFAPQDLELIEPIPEEQKIKVGDWVRIKSRWLDILEPIEITRRHRPDLRLYRDLIGYVVRISGDPYTMQDSDNCIHVNDGPTHGAGDFFFPRDLERIRLKVGDVVRVRSKSIGASDLEKCAIELKGKRKCYIVGVRGNPYGKSDYNNCFIVNNRPKVGIGVTLAPCDLEPLELSPEGKENISVGPEKTSVEQEMAAEQAAPKDEGKSGQEKQAIAIINWYVEILNEKTGNYPLISWGAEIKPGTSTKEELEKFLNKETTESIRVALRQFGVFIYEMLTGHSERTDISFRLDGYPEIQKYNKDISEGLSQIIRKMIAGDYRDAETLKKDITGGEING